jgi:hypothetical protein
VILNCQVVHKIERWPYQFKCGNKAVYVLHPSVRANNPGIEAEFICTADAKAAQDAFGKDCVAKL